MWFLTTRVLFTMVAVLNALGTTQAFRASLVSRIPPPRVRYVALQMSTTTASPGQETNAETVLWLRGLSNTFDGQRFVLKEGKGNVCT